MVHGIGNQTGPDFCDSWRDQILSDHPELKGSCDFIGLYWEDMRQEAAKKYPVIQQDFASLLQNSFDLEALNALLSDENYQLASSYVMDVLLYVGLPDMTLYFLNGCLERLKTLAGGREAETLILAHSLGSAMIPHVLWRLCNFTGSIPFHSLILLASPLGFESPLESLLPDFLEVMGKMSGTDRPQTLRDFALEWSFKGEQRLHFFANENDIVCSDALLNVNGTLRDLIPVRQGFSDSEIQSLQDGHAGCYHKIAFGKPEISSIADNHDVLAYLQHPEFKAVFSALIQTQE